MNLPGKSCNSTRKTIEAKCIADINTVANARNEGALIIKFSSPTFYINCKLCSVSSARNINHRIKFKVNVYFIDLNTGTSEEVGVVEVVAHMDKVKVIMGLTSHRSCNGLQDLPGSTDIMVLDMHMGMDITVRHHHSGLNTVALPPHYLGSHGVHHHHHPFTREVPWPHALLEYPRLHLPIWVDQ